MNSICRIYRKHEEFWAVASLAFLMSSLTAGVVLGVRCVFYPPTVTVYLRILFLQVVPVATVMFGLMYLDEIKSAIRGWLGRSDGGKRR